MWFAIFSEYPWEETNTQQFYSCSFRNWNSLSIGNPSTLIAGNPVNATIAQNSSPGCAFQRLSKKHFNVSMSSYFSVPPTPQINMRRG